MCKPPLKRLSVTDHAFQYQTQKQIQNTVGVYSSLYSDSLAALNVYQPPQFGIGVNWNQMSDRSVPHHQTNSANSQGSTYHGSSTRHTQTRPRPGATTPGGYGVDIKFNSYNRYLLRLKGAKPLRRGIVPPTFGRPILFNPAFPIYGNKTVKTAIVNCSHCTCTKLNCPRITAFENAILFNKQTVDATGISAGTIYVFKQNQQVYIISPNVDNITNNSLLYSKFQIGTVIAVLPNNVYAVKTNNGTTQNVNGKDMLPYPSFPYNNGNYADYIQLRYAPLIVGCGNPAKLCNVVNNSTGIQNYTDNYRNTGIYSFGYL